MPTSFTFPFRRIGVDHSVEGISRVWWSLQKTFKEAGPYVYQLQAGHTDNPNATDWENVGAPVVDGFYAEDDSKRLYGKRLLTFYRLVLVTPAGKYVSAPVNAHGELPEHDWTVAREIIRKERLRHDFVSCEGVLLKRLRYGRTCRTCLDEQTMEVTDSKCPECFGTGFSSGYHPPVPLCVDMDTETIDERRGGASPPGQGRQVIVAGRVLAFPGLSKEDVWCNGKSDERWFIHSIKHTAEKRHVPLVMQVEFRLAPFSDVVYRVPIGGEENDHVLSDLPVAGCGSVEVTHDYGGEDELAYTDDKGCGIVGATILAFTQEDYDLGLRSVEFAKGRTTTIANGRWSFALCLDPGDYILVYEKVGEWGPDTRELVVVPLEPVVVDTPSSSEESVWSDFGAY